MGSICCAEFAEIQVKMGTLDKIVYFPEIDGSNKWVFARGRQHPNRGGFHCEKRNTRPFLWGAGCEEQ